jgi:hypothetical protein
VILKLIMDVYDEGIGLAKEGRSRREIDTLKEAVLPDGRPDKRARMLAEIAQKARLGPGNPTGSAWGKCSAQMEMLRYKDLTKPEYIKPRGIMTFENGDATEAWLRERVHIAYPNMAGLEEKVFYFRVPVTDPQSKEIARRIKMKYGAKGAIWGMVRDDFQPPYLRQNPETKKIEFRMAANQMAGFVLDQKNKAVWAPTYIDQAVIGEAGPTILECKAMSSYAFRRALTGDLDYQKRAQLAGLYAATGCNVSMVGYRKDTAHLVEVFYGRGEKRTRVNILKSNGQQETYWVENGRYVQETEQLALGGAIETKEAVFPADQEWEAAEVWVPADESLLQEMRDRIVRTLLATPGAWWREYGPDFRCPVCQGSGIQTLAKTTGMPLKDGGKPCADCGGFWLQPGTTPRRLGDGEKKLPGATIQPGSGKLEEAALPAFPCGYCPVVQFCWKDAGVRLEITDKPAYIVKREAFEKSGIQFHPVGPAEPAPENKTLDPER